MKGLLGIPGDLDVSWGSCRCVCVCVFVNFPGSNIYIYPLVIEHSRGKWPIEIYVFFQLETSIYGWDFPWLC